MTETREWNLQCKQAEERKVEINQQFIIQLDIHLYLPSSTSFTMHPKPVFMKNKPAFIHYPRKSLKTQDSLACLHHSHIIYQSYFSLFYVLVWRYFEAPRFGLLLFKCCWQGNMIVSAFCLQTNLWVVCCFLRMEAPCPAQVKKKVHINVGALDEKAPFTF